MSILFSSKRRRRQDKKPLPPQPPRDETPPVERYDYVVVGAGSAGCVLASRLSEDQAYPTTVLLLEAGGPDDDPRIHTPRRFEELQGKDSAVDWAYETEEEPQLFNRRIPWPKGKVLGGSSSINALVYIRGNRRDYDEWADLSGDKRWSYDEVLPYFLKSENNTRSDIGDLHGKGGPMTVSDINPPNRASELFIKAAVEKGHGESNDFNDLEQEGGAGLYQVIIEDGKRESSATAFLGPEVLSRPNLTIQTHTYATRLLIKNGRAFGVEYKDYSDPQNLKLREVRANREVIVCCGTVESPKLLMLSGVGPAEHLKGLGIESLVNLPGVGENLQDHPIAPVVYGYKEATRSAPAAAGGVEAGLFIRTRKKTDRPDIQYHFTHKLLGAPGAPIADTAYMIVSTLVRPLSRGRVRLKSKDPQDKPLIFANYLSDGADLTSLVEGVKVARKIGQAKAFDEIRGGEMYPGDKTQTDEQIADFIKHVAIGLYHPVGTCAMGTDPTKGAVVDSELRVHRVKGLRVADASVMPTITTGNTHAPTVMIGERAADLIKQGGKKKIMGMRTVKIENTAQAFLKLLGALGVKHLLGTPGSDVPAILDAFVKFAGEAEDDPVPEPFPVPHEMCAVSMAHAYYLKTGMPPAVLVHSTVGTANSMCGLINASRSNVPLILIAGRTAVTESGRPASRDLVIHWSQESFDQGGMAREFVKWDYELRTFDQLELVVRRAFAIAMTEPRGPVYLVLPRELLGERHDEFTIHEPADEGAGGRLKYTPVTTSVPDPAAVERVARRLAAASDPLIITRSFGRHAGAVGHLVRLAESFAIPVVEFQIAETVNFPADHPLHLGFQYNDPTSPKPAPEPGAAGALMKADFILVIDCPMPWAPNLPFKPKEDAYVVHVGADPIYSNYPVWGFPTNVALAGDSVETVKRLADALEPLKEGREQSISERFGRLKQQHESQRAAWEKFAAGSGKGKRSNFVWVSHCLKKLIAGDKLRDDITVIQEYDLQLPFTGFNREGSYVGFSPAGGLGFGVGGALGLKLADPAKTIISVVGDGTYVLGAPSAAHIVSATRELPVLWVVCNNAGWGYLALETIFINSLQGGGNAQPGHPFPMLSFPAPPSAVRKRPWPAYEKLVAAFGGEGVAVTDPKALPEALREGLRFVREEKRQYLVNVDCLDPFVF